MIKLLVTLILSANIVACKTQETQAEQIKSMIPPAPRNVISMNDAVSKAMTRSEYWKEKINNDNQR